MKKYPSLGKLFLNKNTNNISTEFLCEQFQKNGFVELPSFVDPIIFKLIDEAYQSEAVVVPESWKWLSDRYDMAVEKPKMSSTLMNLFNCEGVINFFRELTELKNIQLITAFLYSIDKNTTVRTMSWHDDNSLSRVFGLSIKANDDEINGGELCIRNKSLGNSVSEINLKKKGDAVLFRINSETEHAVKPLIGNGLRKNIVAFGHLTRPDGLKLNVT